MTAPRLLEVETFDLILPVNPVPLARARVTNGRAYTPARSVAFAEEFRWALRSAGVRRPIDDDLALNVTFWRECRSSSNRGDLSNLLKAVEDAGNGFLWVDDRQITELHARIAEYGPRVDGRIRIRMTYPHIVHQEATE